jgi:MinD-like ATPase involved in chromosome partitioning or flagellar assembly
VTVPVLTAVSGAEWESRLVAALETGRGGVSVARRCVDVADMLASVAAGHGRAVLLSADLRRLDREVLSRVAAAGVAVVGVSSGDDEQGERRLRQLGVDTVVTADADVSVVADAVHAAVGGMTSAPSRPGGADGVGEFDVAGPAAGTQERPVGRLVAVWGPTGAPGRTTLSVNLAAETALLGRTTLLVDADTYGGTIAQVLGLLDEAPGLAGAARAANHGQLDLPSLARYARQITARLRVLTGITRTERWPEVRATCLEVVWALARGLAETTVVDCGFCLEQDEELSFDTTAPQRNGATLSALRNADVVLAVAAADPVGLQRFVRALSDLREAAPQADVRVVVNRLRSSVVGSDPEEQVRAALERYAGVQRISVVPDDRPAVDAALLQGQTLAEAAPASSARLAIAGLAADLSEVAASARSRRRWRVRLFG